MPTSTHPPKRKHPRAGADGRYCTGFQFSPRRGGRPCPPAGIARFYGNPMRNRNILEGRCGHRPLQKTSQDFTILEGGQSRPPLQTVLENRVQVEKPPRCPFHAVGVDAYIDPPSKTETPPRGGGWALLYRVSFSPLQNASQNAIFSLSRRRGGRPCPPAGIARFHGNPMRNRNILEGRCDARRLVSRRNRATRGS